MEAETITLGMRLDAFTAQLDSLSSTQLYGVTVLSSIIFCVLLLNTGRLSKIDLRTAPEPKQSSDVRKSLNRSTEPQPKWYILNLLNLLAGLSFIVSVVAFLSDASTYMQDSLSVFKFLVGWGVFLCYFFGFFGISFVDADLLERTAEAKKKGLTTTRLR